MSNINSLTIRLAAIAAPGGKLERAPGAQLEPMPPDAAVLEPAGPGPGPGRAVPGTGSQTPKR